MDAVRAILVARTEQIGMSLSEVSKKIGANQAYLQQFIRRGIPAVLPEDKREALAALLGLPAEALRGGSPAKGGPKVIAAEAIAQTEGERELLQVFRALDPSTQARALAIVRALA